MNRSGRLEICLIRHGKTKGNLEGRYIGTTDESLCDEGLKELVGRDYPKAEALYTSSRKRCIQTGEILYPGLFPIIQADFDECDFGDFENKNYLELDGNEDYQAWVDSGGRLPFPGGESHEGFLLRCVKCFEKTVDGIIDSSVNRAAFVVHGGTIMAVLDAYAEEKRDFYYWQVKNGRGFVVSLDRENWRRGEKYLVLKETI